MAETIKPSSSRKHLAASLRLVRGPLARQQRQHARLSECAIAQSTALGCQITLKWTAATSMSTPSVCHDAAIHVAHHTVEHRAGRGGDGGRGAEKKEIQREREWSQRGGQSFQLYMWRTCSFYLVLQPRLEKIKCINMLLGDTIPQPSLNTLDKHPRHLSLT